MMGGNGCDRICPVRIMRVRDLYIRDEMLTEDQRRAVVLSPEGHTLVRGYAGSGKTSVCCHRAAFLSKSACSSPTGLCVFVSSDVNLAFLRQMLSPFGIQPQRAETLDRWNRSFYRRHISPTLPVHYLDGRVDDGKTRKGVLALLRGRPDLHGGLEQVVLDDAQEFPPDSLEILKLASRRVHLFHDPGPSLFGMGIGEEKIRDIFGLPGAGVVLKEDHRCPEMLAGLAALWLDGGQRGAFLRRLRNRDKGEKPVYFSAGSPREELDRLESVVRQRAHLRDRVGILVAQPRLVHRLAGELASRGIEVDKAVAAGAQNVFHSPCDFDSRKPQVSTYGMGRGLSFDVVILPFLTRETFSGVKEKMRRFFLFSGISMARKWVHLSAARGGEFEEYALLEKAAAEGGLDWHT
jgi:hypothetical protein